MNKNTQPKSKILLVEDEESLAVGLEYNLSAEGYDVIWVQDGKKAIDQFQAQDFDLIILDIMLPFFNGFEIATLVREKYPQMPILILTARTSLDDRIKGLEIGADDYMTKPFHLEELLLRVKGMLRRKEWYRKLTDDQPVWTIGDCTVNFQTLECLKGKNSINLSQREAMVLRYLVEHTGAIVSRKELLENVWNIHADIDTRTVDNFIVRLRKLIEPNPKTPIFIKSIRSAGYIFVME